MSPDLGKLGLTDQRVKVRGRIELPVDLGFYRRPTERAVVGIGDTRSLHLHTGQAMSSAE